MKFTFGIASYNNANNLILTINTINSAMKNFRKLKYEIIVVDDHSLDETEKKIRKFKGKNKTLVERIKKYSKNKLKFETTDDYGVDGDFVESQAFAFLAIRSFLKLPITFPNTTGCELPSTGGILAKNF